MESPWDSRGREEACWAPSSSPPSRCQACEISTDTTDQSHHLLNTTRWPQSSLQGQENCLDEPFLNFWFTTSQDIENCCFRSLWFRAVCYKTGYMGTLSFGFCLGGNLNWFTIRPIKWATPETMGNTSRKYSPFNISSETLSFEEIFQSCFVELKIQWKQYCYWLLFILVHPNSLSKQSQYDVVERVWALEADWKRLGLQFIHWVTLGSSVSSSIKCGIITPLKGNTV